MYTFVTMLIVSNIMFQCEVPKDLVGRIVIDFSLAQQKCVLHLPEGLEYAPAKIKLIEGKLSV